MRELGQRHVLRLVGAHPRQDGHVGNRVRPRHTVAGARQLAVEHAVQPVDFLAVALDGVGHFFRGVNLEMPVLARHGAQPTHLPHQPFGHLHPAAQVGGQKLAGFFGQVQQDGATFKHRNGRTTVGRCLVHDGGHAVVRADAQKVGRKLFTLADVDQVCGVRQATFLQHDGNLPAVGCRPVIQVDHGCVSFAIKCVASCARRAGARALKRS